MHGNTPSPAKGDLVLDTKRRQFARVVAYDRGLYYLRPIRGGLEWNARQDHIRPATVREVLADRMRAQGLLTQQDAW